MPYQIKDEIYTHITNICMQGFEKGAAPLELLNQAWENPEFPMHCPEHHYLVPAVLLATYRRLKKDSRNLLEKDLKTAAERSRNVLSGFCGWYGACGAAVGAGIFLSLLTDTSPYSSVTWSSVNELTGRCLCDIAALGGPRCCKRTCFTALATTAEYMREHFGLDIGQTPRILCSYHSRNAECRKARCPYFGEMEEEQS